MLARLNPTKGIECFFEAAARVRHTHPDAYYLAVGDWGTRASILAALGNYLVFFGGHWWSVLRSRNLGVRQKARREAMRADAPVFGQRVCDICGAREADGTDIRVCACAKCGGAGTQRALCLEHARNH